MFTSLFLQYQLLFGNTLTKLFADLEMKKKKLEERDAMERLRNWIYNVYNHQKFSFKYLNFYEIKYSLHLQVSPKHFKY